MNPILDYLRRSSDIIEAALDDRRLTAAIEAAERQGLSVVGVAGKTGGAMAGMRDIIVQAPSDSTQPPP